MEEVTIRLIYLCALEGLEVDLRGAEGVMTHGLGDDGERDIMTIGSGGPAMTGDIGGEMKTSKHGTQFTKAFVDALYGIAILLVGVTGVSLISEDGKDKGSGGGITVDNLTHEGNDLYLKDLVGLMTGIADDPTTDITLTEVGDIDKRHTTGTEAEKEEVAGEGETAAVRRKTTATFLIATGKEGGRDVKTA